MEGNLRFKLIGLTLQMEGNLPFLLCFTLYLRAISKYKPPGGLYMEGRFNGRFFALQVWGAYIWKGLIHGGAYFRNFMVFWRCPLCFLFTPKTLCMNIDFKLRKQPSFRDVTTCFPAK